METAGIYSAASQKLTVTDLAPGPAFGIIDCPSNSSFGNWTFDVVVGNDLITPPNHVLVFFMRDARGLWGGVADSVFYLEYLGSTWYLWRKSDPLGSFSTIESWDHHLRVERTRADPNQISVYHNGTLALQVTAIVPTADYSYFSFSATRDSSNDNIVVEHEPLIQTSTTTTTPTTSNPTSETTSDTGTPPPPDMTMVLIIGGGVVAVLVIVAVLKMR